MESHKVFKGEFFPERDCYRYHITFDVTGIARLAIKDGNEDMIYSLYDTFEKITEKVIKAIKEEQDAQEEELIL